MPLTTTFQIGTFKCHTLEAGLQHLDGGAMFGVVPKPLWEKRIAPDARNRIPLAMRPMLVEHPDGLVLIDNGLGNKEDPKFHDIYGIENAGKAPGPTLLEDALAELKYTPADVKWMIDTHLHFDHAGGNTRQRTTDARSTGASERPFRPLTSLSRTPPMWSRRGSSSTRGTPMSGPVPATSRKTSSRSLLPGSSS